MHHCVVNQTCGLLQLVESHNLPLLTTAHLSAQMCPVVKSDRLCVPTQVVTQVVNLRRVLWSWWKKSPAVSFSCLSNTLMSLPSTMLLLYLNDRCMQGVAFTITKMAGIAYLLAANGSSITAVQLNIQSVHIEYTLTGADTAMAAPQGPPRVNRLLNYVHSMCERFPIDDCIRSALHNGPCRNVPLLCMTGVSEPPIPACLPTFGGNRQL
jgi:hypothetical protein